MQKNEAKKGLYIIGIQFGLEVFYPFLSLDSKQDQYVSC